jgi:hypothetical protein
MKVSGQLRAPCRFTTREKDNRSHQVRHWVRPTVGLDTEDKNLALPGIESGPSTDWNGTKKYSVA